MSSSSSLLLLLLTALITLLAHISAAASYSPSASPMPTPAPPPNQKKTSTTPPPVASPTFPPSSVSPPVPDYLAPGPSTTDAGTDCLTLLFGAADCLTYVEEGSNLTVPEKACCPELATLVNTNPICLCELLKNGNSFGITINMSRALALPSVCKVNTPDPSLCDLGNGSPTGSPGSSPAPSGGLSPTATVLPPTTVNNDKDFAVVIAASTSSTLLVALLAYAAAFI